MQAIWHCLKSWLSWILDLWILILPITFNSLTIKQLHMFAFINERAEVQFLTINHHGKALMVLINDPAPVADDEEVEINPGCPHCGSYEGDPTECPECGHGQ